MAKSSNQPVKMKLKVGDRVVVISGSNQGQIGTILRVLPKLNQVVVEDVNFFTRHRKADDQQSAGKVNNTEADSSLKSGPIVEPESQKPSRIGYKINDDGSKVRIYKRTNQPVLEKKTK